MLGEILINYLPILIHIFEIMGVIVLTMGAFTAFYHYVKTKLIKDHYPVKPQFANTMIMALEFKMAAEILKTVLVQSLNELIFLGGIFLIRILMTFVLEKEMSQGDAESSK
ncbi:MAG: DUF1622 domain-containing protein [Clostridium sp.]|uniref:DUF1622 domain-containing protein n=1 Tax=Clostridium sp. TaxID=1506 RepID=UPI0030729BC8